MHASRSAAVVGAALALPLLIGASAASAAYPWQTAARLGSLGRSAPPASGATTVCVADSGVTMTPLLEGRVVDRLRVTPDPGVDDAALHPGDVTTGHGTYVAQTIALTVPWVRILSVRLASDDHGDFTAGLYRAAIRTCVARGASVINLSLGSNGTPSENDLVVLRAVIGEARAAGVDIVAGAGNVRGPVGYPAAAIGDAGLAVAAMDNRGNLCSWASRGPETLIGAPGCDVEMPYALDPSRLMAMTGSSFSSPQVAAVLAAVKAWRPDLSQAQRLAAFAGLEAGMLDGDEVLRRTGLGALITPNPPAVAPVAPVGSGGAAQAPPGTGLPSDPPSTPSNPTKASIRTPRVALRWSGRRLVVRVTGAPGRARISVTVRGRAKSLRSSTVRLTLPVSLSRPQLRVTVRVLDRRGHRLMTRTLRAPRR